MEGDYFCLDMESERTRAEELINFHTQRENVFKKGIPMQWLSLAHHNV